MIKNDVYMHGQILGTHSFLLKDGFLEPDEYSEIKEKYFLPGGETGTAATVLASLGVNVKIDGTHIGTEVAPLLKEFYKDKTVDLSSLYFDPSYEGLMDYVVIAGLVRSPMGVFQALYEPGAVKRWSMPKEKDIMECKVAAIDPYFFEETEAVVELCKVHQKPYVTIDCRHDTSLHKYSAINVVSKECTSHYFANGYTMEDIYQLMVDHTDGLVIITSGEKEMIYGRKGQTMKKMKPFTVDVKSTLGAGDTFKAGCVYGLLNNMPDDELVRFASACSAIAISRFPLPLNPPTLDEVNSLLGNTKKLIIEKAKIYDLKEILELQYLAYQSEAKLFNDPEIPPLKQTLEDVMQEFEKGIVLKATDGSGAIVGSVRAYSENGDVYIGKLIVHPEKQRIGIGTKLLSAIENEYPNQRYELFTSTKSVSNIRLYEGLGYKIFKEVPVSEELQFVYLEK